MSLTTTRMTHDTQNTPQHSNLNCGRESTSPNPNNNLTDNAVPTSTAAQITIFDPTQITFSDPLGQHSHEMEEQQLRRCQVRPISRDEYVRPLDKNLTIYHVRRDRDPWAEQREIRWFATSPKIQYGINREKRALQELRY